MLLAQLQNAPANLDGKLFKGDTFTDLAMTQAKCAQFVRLPELSSERPRTGGLTRRLTRLQCYDKGWQAAGIEESVLLPCAVRAYAA